MWILEENMEPQSGLSHRILSVRYLVLGLIMLTSPFIFAVSALAQSDGGKYLDAKFCGDTLNLNPGSDAEGGSCQLWRLVPDPSGWSRLQLKHNAKFLDAKFCGDELNMNPGSSYDDGSCQLWRFVPAAGGWSRLQIKSSGKFLDASYCTDAVKLSPASDWDGGSCQLWRLVPQGDGWSRLQIKYAGAAEEEFAWDGQTYAWYADGWNGPGSCIVDLDFTPGEGYGGGEGWRGWRHH